MRTVGSARCVFPASIIEQSALDSSEHSTKAHLHHSIEIARLAAPTLSMMSARAFFRCASSALLRFDAARP